MKIDLEMLEAMVASGATGEMVLAMIRLQYERYETARAARRPLEAESKRRTRGGNARTSVDTSGHEVDPSRTSVDTSFADFWKAYPKRAGSNPRAPAEKLFFAAIKAGISADDIIAGARRYASADAAKVGTEFIPQAMKWLRNKCWQDYSTAEQVAEKIDWDEVLKTYKKIGHWSKWAGPDPESPACRVPPEMLEKYGLRTMQ
jgi:hypothetical protein